MSNEVYVQIDWIRHGFSCANALSSLSVNTVWTAIRDLEVKRGKYARDAKLTDIGISQAQLANKKFFKRYNSYDMICCSQLRRAMETAQHLYDGIDKDIFVLPYVNEHKHILGALVGAEKTSTPTDWQVRRAEVASDARFNWLFFETLKIDKFVEPSVKNFYNRVLPLVIYYLKKNKGVNIGSANRPLKIAIVSHQHYIRDILKYRDNISNTGIIAEQLVYNLKKRVVQKSLGQKDVYKPEYIVFNGKKLIYSKGKIAGKYMSKEGIARCDYLEIIDNKKLKKK